MEHRFMIMTRSAFPQLAVSICNAVQQLHKGKNFAERRQLVKGNYQAMTEMLKESEGGVDVKANALDEFVLGMVRKPLYAIHPRRSNRTVTMWRGAVTVRLEETFPAVFKVLHEENILGAPVVTANGRFYGFVDTFDMVRYLMALFPKDQDITKEALTSFFEKEDKATKTTVRELLSFVHPDRNWKEYKQKVSLPKDMSLFFAFESMLRIGRKRMSVVDETQQVYSIVTQSMLVGWLYNNMEDTLKPIKDLPVRSIPGAEKQVSSILETAPTIDAFRMMIDKRVNGLAVVDARGEIVDAISVRDLRGINPTAEDFLRLWRPIRQFKQEIRAKFPTKSPTFTDLYLLPSDTLKTAIVMMDEDRVHRLFLVKSALDKTPIGVITQTDVLRYVLDLAAGALYRDDDDEEVAAAVEVKPATAAKPQSTEKTTEQTAAKSPNNKPIVKGAGFVPEMASSAASTEKVKMAD